MEKTIQSVVSEVYGKNPNLSDDCIILKTIEKLHPEAKNFSFKDLEKAYKKGEFPKVSTILRCIQKCKAN